MRRLCLAVLLMLLPARLHAQDIPLEAARSRHQLLREVAYVWGLDQPAAVFFAQVHQESRWQATARSRFAAGLAQLTPATATEAQARFPALQLLCAQRQGCPLHPGWALRALVLWDKYLYEGRAFAQGDERLAFMLADYNGGPGWIDRERRWCVSNGQCDPTRYFGQVEHACGRSRPGRSTSACRENTRYPAVILHHWRPRYARWLLHE